MAWLVPFQLALAATAAPAPPGGPCDIDAPFRLGPVERVATVRAPAPTGRPFRHRHDSAEVRVRLRFVVGCDGRAEPSSFALVEADDSGYVLSAVALVQASTFEPATVAGMPVRQIVERAVVWRRPSAAVAVEFDCPPRRVGAPPRALHSIGGPGQPRDPPRGPVRRGAIS